MTDMVMRRARDSACECVTPGHPDKVCDVISDAILDAALRQDPSSRVAIETSGAHGIVTINGEMTTKAVLNMAEIARRTYREIGHNHPIGVTVNVVNQSPNISLLVSSDPSKGKELGAGDQGIMQGFATSETDQMMPLPWVLAHQLCVRLTNVRGSGLLPQLLPDGKSQVVLMGRELKHVTIAAHHEEEWPLDQVRTAVMEHVVRYTFPDSGLDFERDVVINGGGPFFVGGFEADSGSTGRKIVVDQYGPDVPVGGGAFSGKDATKVDRSAAYFARLVARSIVACCDAKQALVTVAYAIGQPYAAMVAITTDLPEGRELLLEERVREVFDFRPQAIIERLGLTHPNGWTYQETAASGHYGNPRFPWEQIVEI